MQQSQETPKGHERAMQIIEALKVKPAAHVAQEMGVTVTTIRYFVTRYGYSMKGIARQREVEMRIAQEEGRVAYDRCAECQNIITRPRPEGASATEPRFCSRFKECRNARLRHLYQSDPAYRESQLHRGSVSYETKLAAAGRVKKRKA